MKPKKGAIKKFDPFVGVKDSGKLLGKALSNNPIANVVKNTYSFFYWLPRKNIPFDTPWKLFGMEFAYDISFLFFRLSVCILMGREGEG